MNSRKRLSDSARQFLETGEMVTEATPDTPRGNRLRAEILGDPTEQEASIRFTVDLPRSLHRRLEQLSLDAGKPKTELVRIILKQTLDEMNY